MYLFNVSKDKLGLVHSSRLAELQLFNEFNEVQIQGRLKMLFGEPLYKSDNYENAYAYLIEATNHSGSTLQFMVYQGCCGCAIGGYSLNDEMKTVIAEFEELLRNTEPAEFMYEGYYLDAYVKVRQGIKNGNIIFEELDIEDDEISILKQHS